VITDVYHVPSLSANLLFVPQLTQTGKKVEFWLDWFVVKDMHNNFVVVIEGFLDPKDRLYKFCDFPKKDPGPTTLIAHTND
jgi:hypothetical protein